MSKYIPGNQKHLTLEDRKYIEKSLNAGCSFKDIASRDRRRHGRFPRRTAGASDVSGTPETDCSDQQIQLYCYLYQPAA